jgi:hypothetical protein
MPNETVSTITFVGIHAVIERLVKENLRFSVFFPEVPELAELDAIYPSGYASILERTENSVTFRVESPEDPPLDTLQAFVDLYPGLYIRCLWRDEGGREGLWVRTIEEESVRDIRWYGPCIEAYHMDPNPDYMTEHGLLKNAFEVEQATKSSSNAATSSNQ